MPRTILAVLSVTFLTLALTGQALRPEDALRRMTVPEGFQVKLVAAEPEIRQPVTMTFDDRGRLWVIQYLQYPNPAGLKAVKVDQYLRTKYDKLPEPPPRGPKGADRITILDDPDANGRFRKAKDFVGGLNLASGMAIGHGGVFVAQSPYLLFYPDRNGDDVPDGDPDVLLTGFGMEDAHAFPNSLQWGPDGWLYGAQGSTVTANIRGIEFQQGIWRYHPRTKEFELFAEGGGNTWGIDFDRHGNLIAGTNWGSQTMLHQVQGGYYVKGFGKHGPLHNPHTYGYFEHVPYQGFKGGHVTNGGVIYRGGAFPEKFYHQYIAGNLLANDVYWHIIEPQGSSFTAKFGGDFLISRDPWFRPVDCLVGPDGAVYIADWYDKRATHLDPIDNWDRTNGRIYKVEYAAKKPPFAVSPPLAKRSSRELIELLKHPNDWYVREARRVLAERRDAGIIPDLCKLVITKQDQLALESLWALYVSGGFDDAFALRLFDHPNADVRTWTVRLLGDTKRVSPAIRDQMVKLAAADASPTVRSQLACTAKRLPAADCLAIVRELLKRSEYVKDQHIPLLLWWAIEDKAIAHREETLALLSDPAAWRQPLVQQFILERLARRYMAEGSGADLAVCARLLAAAPSDHESDLLVRGMEKALEGRQLAKVPLPLSIEIAKRLEARPNDRMLLRLALRLGDATAQQRVAAMIHDPKELEKDRINLMEVLSQVGGGNVPCILLQVLSEAKTDNLRRAALAALQPFGEQEITQIILRMYPTFSPDVRSRAQTLLCSRPASSLEFLQRIDAGTISPKEVPLDQLRRMRQFPDPAIQKLVEKHWGKIAVETPGEKRTRISYIGYTLTRGKGDVKNGKAIFTKTCATCHTLFGEGNKIGPDLTGADRKNRDELLLHTIDPNAVIRAEFAAHTVLTTDGRLLTGLMVESNPKSITLVDAKNERTVLSRDKIDQVKPSDVSLMPEKLLDELDDQQVRDLFSYLQGDGKGK